MSIASPTPPRSRNVPVRETPPIIAPAATAPLAIPNVVDVGPSQTRMRTRRRRRKDTNYTVLLIVGGCLTGLALFAVAVIYIAESDVDLAPALTDGTNQAEAQKIVRQYLKAARPPDRFKIEELGWGRAETGPSNYHMPSIFVEEDTIVTRITVRYRLMPVYGPDGKPVHTGNIFYDVRSLKKPDWQEECEKRFWIKDGKILLSEVIKCF